MAAQDGSMRFAIKKSRRINALFVSAHLDRLRAQRITNRLFHATRNRSDVTVGSNPTTSWLIIKDLRNQRQMEMFTQVNIW
jgi:hypothetical protein